MNEEKSNNTYETPSLEVIQLSTTDGVLQFASPGSGGGEGIGGGTDL